MTTEPRWEAERRLMANGVPQFLPYREDGFIGFYGLLQGLRTGRIYEVVIRASVQSYPSQEPKVYMQPHAEGHHWIRGQHGGHLCYDRTERSWKPSRDTFLKTLHMATEYIADFDGGA